MTSATERKVKALQYLIFAGGLTLGVAAAVIFTFLTKSSEPAKKSSKTTSTQIAVAPNNADFERQQALYNERLVRLEKEARSAKSKELKTLQDKKRLEERVATLEAGAKRPAAAPRSLTPAAAPTPEGWPPEEVLGKTPVASERRGIKSGVSSSQSRYATRAGSQSAEALPSERAPRLAVMDFEKAPKGLKGAQGAKSGVSADTAQKEKERVLTYLPSGSFARARLLNGATVPTKGQGSGNPVPVLLELTDSAVMPNLYRSGIKRCFVTAHATGELASERALIRLDRLSCIDEEGGAVDQKLQGYVSGEDGKTGLRGRLVTKSGQAIANALFTGTLSGLGKAVSLAAENQTTSITGTVSTSVTNPWRASVGAGASHALDRITEYYLKLATDMFPVLEIDSGREVEIVISNGLSIDRIQK